MNSRTVVKTAVKENTVYPLYNVTEPWAPMSKEEFMERQKNAFDEGRRAGFQAGFAAATEQPAAKIEEAFKQGKEAGYLKAQQDFFRTPRPMTPLEDEKLNELLAPKKNGVGY